jgi:Uma2 family endonuclease
MLPKAISYISKDEYLDMERNSEVRHEYYDGELFAMAGGTPNHNRIVLNLTNLLNAGFSDRHCEAFASDIRIQLDKNKHYAYPDVVAVCGEPEFADNRKDTILNPILIAEVLSDSTEAYDRGLKFKAYQNIKHLKHYLLIKQDAVTIDYFLKQGSTWQLRRYDKTDDVIFLASLELSISVTELYKRVLLRIC